MIKNTNQQKQDLKNLSEVLLEWWIKDGEKS